MGFIGVLIALYLQDWFGIGDTYSLLFWTIPLATGLAVSGRTILTLFRTRNRAFRILLSLITAGLISFGFVHFRTREVILRNVTTASGKALRLSDNPFMFEDVKVDTN